MLSEVILTDEDDDGGAGGDNVIDSVGYEFRFGVTRFPSLYADVMYILPDELDLIFDTPSHQESKDSGKGTRLKSLPIGTSSVFHDYDVKVVIDSFFGGHAAVLGNTGSGKSCTVAAIIQELFERAEEYRARGAMFLVFDVNGEYRSAFSALPSDIETRSLELDGSSESGKLTLPHWLLDTEEWELLLRASDRTQIPVLRNALGIATFLSSNQIGDKTKLRRHIIASAIAGAFKGDVGGGAGGKGQLIWTMLERWSDDELSTQILRDNGFSVRYGTFSGTHNLTDTQAQQRFWNTITSYIDPTLEIPTYRCAPFPFKDLEVALELAVLYEESKGNRQIRDYCSSLFTRYTVLKDRSDFAFIRDDPPANANTECLVQKYFSMLLGLSERDGSLCRDANVVVVDMSGVDDEIVELVTAFTSRTIFRSLRDAEKRNQFPIHLVLEEAHRYVAERPSRFAIEASRVFERIAKEGRKYGLLLILASQRPSELSKTVLSQCANFIVHRIQNPDDLTQIRQMTPAISEAVLKRLPTLPRQHALAFGTAISLPTTFRVRAATPKPDSQDAKISRLWYRSADNPLTIDFGAILRRSAPSAVTNDPGGDATKSEPSSAGFDELDDEIPF